MLTKSLTSRENLVSVTDPDYKATGRKPITEALQIKQFVKDAFLSNKNNRNQDKNVWSQKARQMHWKHCLHFCQWSSRKKERNSLSLGSRSIRICSSTLFHQYSGLLHKYILNPPREQEPIRRQHTQPVLVWFLKKGNLDSPIFRGVMHHASCVDGSNLWSRIDSDSGSSPVFRDQSAGSPCFLFRGGGLPFVVSCSFYRYFFKRRRCSFYTATNPLKSWVANPEGASALLTFLLGNLLKNQLYGKRDFWHPWGLAAHWPPLPGGVIQILWRIRRPWVLTSHFSCCESVQKINHNWGKGRFFFPWIQTMYPIAMEGVIHLGPVLFTFKNLFKNQLQQWNKGAYQPLNSRFVLRRRNLEM